MGLVTKEAEAGALASAYNTSRFGYFCPDLKKSGAAKGTTWH